MPSFRSRNTKLQVFFILERVKQYGKEIEGQCGKTVVVELLSLSSSDHEIYKHCCWDVIA